MHVVQTPNDIDDGPTQKQVAADHAGNSHGVPVRAKGESKSSHNVHDGKPHSKLTREARQNDLAPFPSPFVYLTRFVDKPKEFGIDQDAVLLPVSPSDLTTRSS